MSWSVLTIRIPAALAVALLGGVLCGYAQTQKRGRPIEFSDAPAAKGSTNSFLFSDPSKAHKELQEDLFSNSPLLDPSSSLDGVIKPPMRRPGSPLIETKKLKEYLDRKKNWALMEPDELLGKTEDSLTKSKFEKGTGKKKENELEDESEMSRLEDQLSRGKNQNRLQDDPQRKGKGQGELPDLENSHRSKDRMKTSEDPDPELLVNRKLREAQDSLKGLVDTDSRSQGIFARERNPLTDRFGFDATSKITGNEPSDGEKARMDRFKQMLSMPANPTAASSTEPVISLNGLAAPNPSSASVAPTVGGMVTPPPSRESITPSFAGASSPLSSSLINPSASSLAPQPSFGSALPKIEVQPPKLAPPTPNFNAPKRPF
jgi:hypothetical protein